MLFQTTSTLDTWLLDGNINYQVSERTEGPTITSSVMD